MFFRKRKRMAGGDDLKKIFYYWPWLRLGAKAMLGQ